MNKTNREAGGAGVGLTLFLRRSRADGLFGTPAKSGFTSRRSDYIRTSGVMRIVGSLAVLMVSVLVAVTIVPIQSERHSAEATVGTAKASTLTFDSSNATASVNLNITSADGTFATSTDGTNNTVDQRVKFSISTNNATGYTVKLTATGATTTLSDGGSGVSEHTIASIESATPLADFTDTGSTGQALNNKWGYIPNYYNSVANTTTYYPAPTNESEDTLRVTGSANAADGVSNADEYTIGLGLRADYTNPSGTYANDTFIIQYVANQIAYEISFNDDTGDASVTNLPGTLANSTTETSVALPTTIPTRTGYTFSKWCLGTVSSNGTVCTGTEYDASTNNTTSYFGIDQTVSNANIELYATWIANTYAITFTFDSNITDVVIKDSTETSTIATISTSNTSTNLTYGVTYKIVPTFIGNYELDAMTKTIGVGMLNGNAFTVSNGTAAISVTSWIDLCKGKSVLYDLVSCRSRGKNTDASSHFSWTSITTPTTTKPATDTSTSGVFEWDGTDSNSGGNNIYFYRGILDTTTATYGSNGLADAYPNYVRLGDTCWRIVRTTSTGGVKMIYNGSYSGGTTANSCANTQTNAQLTTSPFNTNSATVAGTAYTGLQYQNIHAVGYTYNGNIAAGTTATKTPAQLFGASGNDTTTNNQSSIIKQYIEDWYAANMTSYTSILEGDAGYCQDRRLNTSTTWTTPLAEDSNTIVPYGTSGLTQYYFGAYPRNAQSSTFNPLLTCPRGKVDLYSYSGDAGNGNGQLTYPVALLTADEASLAGNGWSNSFSAYNANSFLRSGSNFWLLSPGYRLSVGYASGFFLTSSGSLYSYYVYNAGGVRPAISLEPGTTVSSGSGIATDPWLILAP